MYLTYILASDISALYFWEGCCAPAKKVVVIWSTRIVLHVGEVAEGSPTVPFTSMWFPNFLSWCSIPLRALCADSDTAESDLKK